VKPVPIYSGTVGLDNVHAENDIGFDKDTGVTALSKAVNVVIDESAAGRPRISRCKGFTELVTGDYNSGWSDGEMAYCQKGTAIYRMNPEGTFTGVRSNMTGARVAFVRHGERVYYSNGVQNGYIIGATSNAWVAETYSGPTTQTHFSAAPKARCLAVFNGRMYLSDFAEPDVLYWSEPTQPGLYNLVPSHRVIDKGRPILMIAPVNSGDAGMFISTDKATYFVTGAPDIKIRQVAGYPAYEGGVVQKKYSCRSLGIDMNGDAVVWRATTGLCAGLPDGTMLNLTDAMVDPGADCGDRGAVLLVGDQCIHTVGGQTLITNLAIGKPSGEKATTQRTNFGFNSYIELAGSYYGLSSSGVFTLGGSTDDGAAISAYFKTGTTNLGSSKPMRAGYCYFTMEADGAVYLKVTPNKDTTLTETFNFTPTTDKFHTHREKLGKGLRAGTFGFEFGNTAGSDFSVYMIEAAFQSLSRRLNQY